MWEDRGLRDITEADLRQLIDTQLEEHLQLEYKSALYETNDQGSKESLLDICMFANAGGGILLIGISEQRDENGQPTGFPDPAAQLGIEIPNTEMVLQSYDARVIASIEERLPLESRAIPVPNNRHVLAIRVPNSMSKPHRVHYKGRTYFPSRRERQRYEMDVREIKEMVMRTKSRLEEAEARLSGALKSGAYAPEIAMGTIPVFWQNFMVDIRRREVIHAVSGFHLGHGDVQQPTYTFSGLARKTGGYGDSEVLIRRDGGIILNRELGLSQVDSISCIRPAGIDIILRAFVGHCSDVYRAAVVSGPFLLSMHFGTPHQVSALFPTQIPNVEERGDSLVSGDYPFPVVQMDDFSETDKVIRPLCDQAHQMFGRRSSPNFNADGAWNRRGY